MNKLDVFEMKMVIDCKKKAINESITR